MLVEIVPRAWAPSIVYPAAAIPPASASASPSSARSDRSGSAPVARATPTTATPTPAHVLAGTRTPRTTEISDVQMGVVLTSATDMATLVSLALGTHVAKCTASSTPDAALTRIARDRNSSRRAVRATGAIAATPSALRQKAIASAGAAA
ncbi:hypothetical protein GCM10009827_099160 [Dactylosporangium maewongense]|uniref:Uncharacterized protein n=1 Tax=Dactylosporangium maewongense TaxID=634393 RepID=A0ABN2CP37_9ACTN